MSVDIVRETLIRISQAPEHLPGPPHRSTVWRWVLHGVRGVKLASVVCGTQRYTSIEAIERFVAATTAAADGEAVPKSTARKRQQQIDHADRELREKGV